VKHSAGTVDVHVRLRNPAHGWPRAACFERSKRGTLPSNIRKEQDRMQNDVVDNLEQQLRSLYEERECLQERFGISSADELVSMIECLENQLRDFYGRFGSQDTFGDNESAVMLDRLKELSSTLDQMYSRKSVHFFMQNDKPVLRAEWSETLNQGDSK